MVEELKMEYNQLLNRYYNGCNYVSEHIETFSKYYPEVMKIETKMNKLLEQIPNATEDEILGGFKI